jgi:magnesium-transporting ATPase (P-type)
MDWYRLEAKEVLHRLKTPDEGLDEETARERLAAHGPNRLAGEGGIDRLKLLAHQFTSPLIYILILAAVVTVLLSEYIDAGVILFVVLLNAVIGYFQEFKAEESVRALRKLEVPTARVLRAGREREIPSEELVPGDIVLLASGARVPADLRLIQTLELAVEEAMLTGESLPAPKSRAPIPEKNLTPGDQRNMAFMGTIVLSGRGKGVVVAAGGSTVLGTIAREVTEIGPIKAPLQEKIDRFARAIGLMVLGAAVLLFLVGLLVGESTKDMFMTAVTAAVAAVPEGLPIVVTIVLAIGVARMARQNAIIRKLPAVETLGSTTVICSDKTGTLTRNEMTVRRAYDGSRTYEVTGTGYEPEGEILHDGSPADPREAEALLRLLRIGALCTESAVYEEEGRYKVDGDPTEGALLVSAMKAGLRLEEEREGRPLVSIVPFESERGYMATLHRHGRKKEVFVKGAPERVVPMCSIEEEEKHRLLESAGHLAAEGLRVLAFAWKEAPPGMEELTHRDVESGFLFAGLQAMMDPARPEAIEAVEGCRRAGIRVVMITGDHAVTAGAVARALGIGGKEAAVLTGKQLEPMEDDELFRKTREVSIYARVSPQHKLRIAQQLIRGGEIVAMTGDGVNDAPSLKAAHIGIAMGKTGTDVAKEASDMVLADDNFASIFQAVREGRIVFDNIRKVTFFLIPTGLASILSIVVAVLLGMPSPYLPAQILWINLVTNGLQDVALAFEPGEEGTLDRPPRDPREGIMSRLLIERTVLVGLIISAGVIYNFLTALHEGAPVEKARSIAMTTMVFFQFFQVGNSRSEHRSLLRISPFSNPFLLYSTVAALFAQLAVLYVPALQWVFRTVPLDKVDWMRILAVSLTIVAAVELDKWIRGRAARGRRTA